MPGLLDKLRMLDAEPKKRPAQPKNENFACYARQRTFPLSLFPDSKPDSSCLQSLFSFSGTESFSKEDFLFLDTETTGLSGGAGTLAFEIGIGYFNENSFCVEQFLMRDYSAEEEMLNRLSGILRRFPVLVTFNGRTFDVPLLKSRFRMNRISDECIPTLHADVLYPSRRLWKLRLKSCSLGHLEEELLHVCREEDLPGALVPQTYFQYLKDGIFDPLVSILDHNQQDIVSLAQLFFFMCKFVSEPEKIENSEDLFSLANALSKSGKSNEAGKCYRLCMNTRMRSKACVALGREMKRNETAQAAAEFFREMLRKGDEPVHACEELAKLCEHKLGDLPSALAYTRQAMLLLAEPGLSEGNSAVQMKQKELQYRYARLRRKIVDRQQKEGGNPQ